MAYELPTNSRSPDDGPTTIATSAEIFGKVAAQSPEELIDEHRFGAIKAAIDNANSQRVETTGEEYDPFYVELVRYGIRDTGTAIDNLALGKSVDERLEAVRDRRSMLALGMLANRSEDQMQSALSNDRNYGSRLVTREDSTGKTYLEFLEDDLKSREAEGKVTGCPFAALNADQLPSPAYVRFATWSAEMMIRLERLEFETKFGKTS